MMKEVEREPLVKERVKRAWHRKRREMMMSRN